MSQRWAAIAVVVLVLAVVAFAVVNRAPGPGAPPAPSRGGAVAASPLASTASRSATPTGSSSAGPTTGGTSAPPASAPSIPTFGHVFVVVMENKESGSILGNPSAPYINELADRYGLASSYSGVAHPSLPNYLALWSGSTQGVDDDRVYNFTTGTTLADQIEAAGRSWHVAAENVPPVCYKGAVASGGEDGSGTYARKHEPAISWTSVSSDPKRCANITDFSHFDPNVGNFWLIVPNLCHDTHDCSIATGDDFMKSFMPRILTSAAFANSVVFLTWDEGTTSIGGGGNTVTLVISPLGKASFESSTPHDHYSLLRTIESAWGMPCLAKACDANDLREFFR
jgi:hypothetical protein